MKIPGRPRPGAAALLFSCLVSLCLVFCGTSPKGGAADPPPPDSPGGTESRAGEELRRQVELGSPSTLARAAELLRDRDLAASGQGRALAQAAAALAASVYPGSLSFPAAESAGEELRYGRILREAGAGTYTAPAPASRDFLEYVLPFLALYTAVRPDPARLRAALPHLDRAAALNGESVLPGLFRGYALEKAGEEGEAAAAYRRALDRAAGSCYPAELGLARLALLRRDWQEAAGLTAEVLRRDSRNGPALLIRARLLLEQGFYQQAQAPLDAYGAIDSSGRQYLFLRARLQAEGNRNREAAIALLRPLARSDPEDPETALYLASLLLESSRREDNDEGRALLFRFTGSADPSPEGLALAAANAVLRENWREAKGYLDRLLPRRRARGDLLTAWKVERALGNNAAALAHARELYNRDNADEEGVTAYVISLTDTGRQAEAARIIDQRLTQVPGGPQKSRYYYLRSRLRSGDDAVMNDLRSALFEDPRNLDALIAMFEIYHRRKDERRAVYYLRQALVIAPDNPLLKRYEGEYRGLLN